MTEDNKIILLVEDEVDDQLLLQHALEQRGVNWQIMVASDGAEALAYLFGEPFAGRRIALVLLDLKLPKVSGLEVLERMRADSRTEFVPVVIFTSSVEQSDLERSYQLCCNSYIRKPVNFHQFLETVRQAVAYWVGLNELPVR